MRILEPPPTLLSPAASTPRTAHLAHLSLTLRSPLARPSPTPASPLPHNTTRAPILEDAEAIGEDLHGQIASLQMSTAVG